MSGESSTAGRTLRQGLLAVAILNAVNYFVSLALAVGTRSFLNFFALLSLLEAALLLLLAGGMDFSTSIHASKVRQYVFKSGKEWSAKEHRRAQRSAVKYLIIGLVMLAEAFAVPTLLR